MANYKQIFKIAYKKLKSSVYYDKTLCIVRDRIVEFEESCSDIDACLEDLANKFSNKTSRKLLFDEILNSVGHYVFPKTLDRNKNDSSSLLVKNYYPSTIEVSDNQYFIDIDIRGHILGVVWLMMIGYRVDEKLYQFSYGNRLCKNMYRDDGDSPSSSPYLFEPYFRQYESWRDNGLNKALDILKMSRDVILLTMDFKRFYYSLDITKSFMERIFVESIDSNNKSSLILKDLNDFIFRVIEKYSNGIRGFDGRNILPIGFLPSNVLANYYLDGFDKAVIDEWNPQYYGRYVDDIVLVYKCDSDSYLYEQAKNNELDSNKIISFFIGDKGSPIVEFEEDNIEDDADSIIVNSKYLPQDSESTTISVNRDKLKLFYFMAGQSAALITCFRDKIAKNSSEFRHMPEDEDAFQRDDYYELYDLENCGSVNVIHGVSSVSINKYELSKYLGKQLHIESMISRGKSSRYDYLTSSIISSYDLIDNYTAWEKIIEICVIDQLWDTLFLFVQKILESIKNLNYKDNDIIVRIRQTLLLYLCSVLARALSLVFGDSINGFISRLDELFDQRDLVDYKWYWRIEHRIAYLHSRMIDNKVIPICFDMIDIDRVVDSSKTVNLNDFKQVIRYVKDFENVGKYKYYPYMITYADLCLMQSVYSLLYGSHEEPTVLTSSNSNLIEKLRDLYVSMNFFGVANEKSSVLGSRLDYKSITDRICPNRENSCISYYSIGAPRKDVLRVAIANVRMGIDQIERVVVGNVDRSVRRYKILSKIINEAIDENVDLLVMPELFVPYEWIPALVNKCKNNGLGIITGVEYVRINDSVFNLTAVILPFEDSGYKDVFVNFHIKTNYAPEELNLIDYRLSIMRGGSYELYRWRDCYFPVYCCYELASINDRSLFQSYADFIVAIEMNRDVNYFSNIVESLSRDIHCYFIQVNTSEYGDSRITKPSKTENKDIVRTKGGINSTILVDEIDIKALRKFQIKGYHLQNKDKSFKYTPPGFDPDVVLKKIRGEDLFL